MQCIFVYCTIMLTNCNKLHIESNNKNKEVVLLKKEIKIKAANCGATIALAHDLNLIVITAETTHPRWATPVEPTVAFRVPEPSSVLDKRYFEPVEFI